MPSLGSVLVLSPCEPSVVADSPTSLVGMGWGCHLFRPIEWHLLPSSPVALLLAVCPLGDAERCTERSCCASL